jgi:hypothetical protein
MSSSLPVRRGDVMFIPIAALPSGERRKREDGTVAYGEVTGHSHRLAQVDRESAEVLEIRDGLYVRVSENGAHSGGALVEHPEHLPVRLPLGDYEIRIQREYSPEAIRDVAD